MKNSKEKIIKIHFIVKSALCEFQHLLIQSKRAELGVRVTGGPEQGWDEGEANGALTSGARFKRSSKNLRSQVI